jgi:mono/diheme cytochrome c family protein
MKHKHWCNLQLVLFLTLVGLSASMNQAIAQPAQTLERGKYLVTIGGCNDCHTPGYLLSEGKTPEALWLTGSSFGWRGPWGTTYPPQSANAHADL